MARARRLIVVLSLVFLFWLPTTSALRHFDWRSASGPAWARGPIWYIMTQADYSSYRRLRSDDARRSFVREFWRMRDPIPSTDENELEREFWDRVRTADAHFGQNVKPGWKTQRGKVFIMLGPPENFERDSLLRDTWGSSPWVYDLGTMPLQLRLVLQDSLGVPVDRRVVNLKVRPESEGSRSVAATMPLDDSVLRPTDFLPLAERLVRRVPGPDALRNLGHVMRVPEVLDRLRSRVHVASVFSHVPVEARIDFRPAPGGDRLLTTIAVTLSVKVADLLAAGVTSFDPGGPILTGYLTPVTGGEPLKLTGAFQPDRASPGEGGASPGRQTFQGVMAAAPGRYVLDVAYQDTEERIMGAVRDLIDVPAFAPEGLRLGSLVLCARAEKEAEQASTHSSDPFQRGAYHIVPRTSQVYQTSETLGIFYEVLGAMPDATGLPRLDVIYQFYVQDGAAWLPVGASITLPERRESEQVWSVPLTGWPEGKYRIEATVTDLLTGEAAVRGALFEVRSDAL